jgi:hypothetical protein
MSNDTRKFPPLRLLIGAAAAILLTGSGIAVMAWAPGSPRLAGETRALPSARTDDDARGRLKCAECGVVESTRVLALSGEAGADQPTRGGMREIAGKPASSHEVTVRMANGSRRVFIAAPAVSWRAGERLILIDGASQSND